MREKSNKLKPAEAEGGDIISELSVARPPVSEAIGADLEKIRLATEAFLKKRADSADQPVSKTSSEREVGSIVDLGNGIRALIIERPVANSPNIISDLRPKDVVQLEDGNRIIVLSMDGDKATAIEWDGKEHIVKEISIKEILATRTWKHVERSSDPALINGTVERISTGAAMWRQLGIGSRIYYQNGNVEEILHLSSGINETRVWVDSIFYGRDGSVQLLEHIARADVDLVGPDAPTVAQKNAGRDSEKEVNSSSDISVPSVIIRNPDNLRLSHHPLRFAIQDLFETLYYEVAKNAIQSADKLLKQGCPDASKRFLNTPQAKLFEELLAEIKDFYNVAESLKCEFDNLISYTLLNSNIDGTTKWMSELAGEITLIPNQILVLTQTVRLKDKIVSFLSKSTRLEPLPLEILRSSQRINEGTNRLLNKLTLLFGEPSALSNTASPSRSIISLEYAPAITPNVLLQISSLASAAKKDPNDEGIRNKGVVVSNYSITRLEQMLADGARLITHRESQDATKPYEVKGFMLYYPPATKLPEDGEYLVKRFNALKLAYVDLVLIAPDAIDRHAFQNIFNAHLVDLQFSEASFHVGEIHPQNTRSFRAMMEQGGIPVAWERSPWLPILVPVAADTRARHSGLRELNTVELVHTFDEKAKSVTVVEGGIELPGTSMTREEFIEHGLTANKPVFVRIAGGSANMARADYRHIKEVMEGAKRLAGFALYDKTMMLIRTDEKITLRTKPDINTIAADLERENRNAAFGGLVLYDPREVKSKEIAGYKDGEPVMVISEGTFTDKESGEERQAPSITIEDNTTATRYRVAATSDGEGSIWDQGFKEAIKIAHEYSAMRPDGPVKKILIEGGGGGTIGREIAAWAELGWDIILINGCDPSSASQKYIDNKEWLAAHSAHVHVVNSAEEMAATLEKLGALDTAPKIDFAEIERAFNSVG